MPRPGVADDLSNDLIRVRGAVSFEREEGGLLADLSYTLVPGATELAFLLNAGLDAEISGTALADWQRSGSEMNSDWDRLLLTIRPGFEGRLGELRFELSGRPIVPESGINQISPDWVELGVDAMWHPVIENLDREFEAELELGLPDDWIVVSSGEVEPRESGFLLDSSIRQVDLAFTAAPGLERAAGGHYEVFHRGADSATIDRLLGRANDCRAQLDSRFGGLDPLPRGRFVMAERSESGYARKNYVVLTDVSNQSHAALTDFLCHELAHYWSSEAAAFSVDNWLNEGFATLVGLQAVRALIGSGDYAAMLEDLEAQSRGLGSVWTKDDPSRRSYAIQYKKAPVLLLRLEERIGTDTFERFVRAYMAGIDSTPELLDVLAELTDSPTRQWFEELLAADERQPD